MKIIVCGGGQVGVGIARQLTKESNDVTIIDDNEENIRRIRNSLEVSVQKGFPAHPNVLHEAGLDKAEMVIAVTTSDEVNMVICQIAHSLFDVPIKIARLRNRNYLDPIWQGLYRKDHLPIDYIISPELEVAKAIISRLHAPGAMDSIEFVNGKIRVTEVRCEADFPLKNMTLAEIKEANPNTYFNIMAIYRDGKPFLPKLTDKILEKDEIFFAAENSKVPSIMPLFGHEEEEARRLVIVGGGNIGSLVAENLSSEPGLNIKIIEMGKERAEKIASRLDGITVLNGNALDKDIMQEAGIKNTETIIAVTDDDEVNILSCILAKKSGCKRSICLINKGRSYLPLISSLGIDVDVNPRETTVSTILQHIRKGKVKAAHSLYSGSMEIVETTAEPSSTIIGRSINDLELPNDVKVSAIINKEGRIFSPDGATLIKEGDSLLIICKTDSISQVDEIFSDSKDYF
jgi:trk system potassium uptake protein TrkA